MKPFRAAVLLAVLPLAVLPLAVFPLVVLPLAVLPLAAAAAPPPTPSVPHVDQYFGMTFSDPYHWMEDGGPRFEEWLTAQSAYTRATLDAIPGRAALLDQLRRLDAGETRVSGATRAGGQFIYSKTRPDDAVAKIFVRPLAGGAERVLIDPARFDAGGQAGRLDYWSASPDGRHIAYGVSLGGAETGTLHVMDVATGADLPEAMDRTRYARPSWIDNTAFLYSRLPAPPPGGTQRLNGGSVFLHRVGTPVDTDIPAFGPGLLPGRKLPVDFFFRGVGSVDSSIAVGEYDAGLGNSPKAMFTADERRLGPRADWHMAARLDDDMRGAVLHGDALFLRSARAAPRQRIIRISAAAPDLAKAQVVLPEGSATIADMVAASDALYVQLDEAGLGRLVRIPWGGKPENLATPFDGSIVGLTANAAEPGIVLRMQGWVRSQAVFAYDPATKQFVDTGIAPPSAVSFADIQATDTRVRAADGAMVPVTIVAPRGAVPDGHHPTLLYAYGAYGITLQPYFDPSRRVWFDHGGIYVVVHVRGSGGFGDDWHRAGRLAEKRNSITDFIAAAEYMVKSGWATPATLSAWGGSAGAIVIGGAVTARPHLIGAALIEVGLLNMLRLEKIPIGPFNTGEFGATDTEEGVRMLAAIDAYQNVRDHVAYPGVLVATGRNDARVSPWMPAKFAARLQAATTGPRPVLLRVNDAGGHAGGTKADAETEEADYYSFLLWQAGLPDFQPPAAP
jgi:prolyl oligopeptidase